MKKISWCVLKPPHQIYVVCRNLMIVSARLRPDYDVDYHRITAFLSVLPGWLMERTDPFGTLFAIDIISNQSLIFLYHQYGLSHAYTHSGVYGPSSKLMSSAYHGVEDSRTVSGFWSVTRIEALACSHYSVYLSVLKMLLTFWVLLLPQHNVVKGGEC